MIEIIPSINVADFNEAVLRIRQVESFVKWVHLDVSDGTFSKHVSWHNPHDLVGFEPKVKIEVHLMIENPEKEIDEWLMKPISRIIFHQEATRNHQLIIEKIKKAKKKVGIAIRPDTSWLKLFPYLDTVDMLQLLAVSPGPSGQNFQEEILHKIGHIRSVSKKCIIEIDGGVNIEVVQACAREGANVFVAGKAIFGAEDIKKAIKELKSGK